MRFSPLHVEHSFANYNGNIALSYDMEDQHKSALKYAKISFNFAKQAKNYTSEDSYKIELLALIVKSYTKLKRFNDAQPYVDSLVVALTNQKINGLATAEIGYYYHQQKDYIQAAQYYQKAANEYKNKTKSKDFSSLVVNYQAELAYDKQLYLESLNLYQQLLTKYAKQFKPKNNTDLPNVKDINDNFKVLKITLRKLAIFKKLYLDNNNLEILADYQNHSALAIRLLNQLRDGVERDNSKTTLLNLSFQAYEHSIRGLLLTKNKNNEKQVFKAVFQQMEDSKAFLLSAALQEQIARTWGGIPEELVNLEKELTYNIEFYNKKQTETDDLNSLKLYQNYVFQFSQRLDSLKVKLSKEYPKYHELKYAKTFVDIENIQSTLANNELMLAYLEGYDDIFLLQISKTAIQAQTIHKPENYSKLVKDFRAALTNTKEEYSIKQYLEISTILYQLLIPENIAKSVNRLIVIADGSLHYLPFENLCKQQKYKY